MLQPGFICVQREEARKLSFIFVIFVVTSHANENRVTSNLKWRNHISTYLDITENSVQYVWVWSKISKEKDCVCTVQQMQKAQFLCSEGL